MVCINIIKKNIYKIDINCNTIILYYNIHISIINITKYIAVYIYDNIL